MATQQQIALLHASNIKVAVIATELAVQALKNLDDGTGAAPIDDSFLGTEEFNLTVASTIKKHIQ